MDADIILNGNRVTLEGDFLETTAADLVLNCPERRKQDGNRRALVHGFEDDLVINYAHDYPGGVKLDGHVRVLRKLSAAKIEFDDFVGFGTESGASLEEAVAHPGRAKFESVDLADVIRHLKGQIAALTARIETLEKRVGA